MGLQSLIPHKERHAAGGTDPIAPADIGALGLASDSYVIASPGDDLAAKYDAAKALTPRGLAKSATNRASLIIFPGAYPLAAELLVDTDFVDVLALGSLPHTPSVLLTGNTILVSAGDVRVVGVSVGNQSFRTRFLLSGGVPDTSQQFFENCVGGDNSFGASREVIIEGGAQIEYASANGTYIGCSGGDHSFGWACPTNGTFINCKGGAECFGWFADSTGGYLQDCEAGDYSFAQIAGIDTAIYENCRGGAYCWSYFGGFQGSYNNCTAGSNSFGTGGGILNAVFKNCTAGPASFGGLTEGTLYNNGTYIGCRLTSGQFPPLIDGSTDGEGHYILWTGNGRIINCLDGEGDIVEGAGQ